MNDIKKPKKGIYKHFKGNYYLVIDIGKHTDTLEEFIIYKALYDNGDIWIRPLYQFNEAVKYNNECVPRFKFIMYVE